MSVMTPMTKPVNEPIREIGLVNVTGRDRPGLLAQLMGTLARFGVNILDIGQAVIHEHISLGILIEIPSGQPASEVLKELLLLAHDLEDIQVRYSPIPLPRYEAWVAEQSKERRIVTLMGRKLTASQIAAVAAICARHNLNIDVITRLSGRASLERPQRYPKAAVQLSVSGPLPDEKTMRAELADVAQQMGIDIAFHMDDIYRRNRRLVAFDMDSTLVQIEGIDELAKIAGVGEQVAAITAAAMRGEIDFRQSLTQRVALVAGLDASVL
jgi:phosphoserine phosphatase